MNTRNIFTKLSIAVALAAIASAATIWEVRRVKAATPADPLRTVGMIGMTRGQTMRLNIVDLAIVVDGQFPPDPCRVVLSFRDASGQPFTDSDGQVIRRAVELQAGQSAFLDLNADLFISPLATDATDASGRLQLRPFVRVLSEPAASNSFPPDPCRATMEVVDNTSGRTSIFAGEFRTPPDALSQQ